MKKGYLYIALTTIIFSSMEVMLKLTGGVFHPLQITALRFLIGGVMLVPFAVGALKKKGVVLAKKDLLRFAGLGFVGMVLSMCLYQMAVKETPASVVAVLFSSNPIFVTVMAYLILREPIRKNHVLALVFDLIGILVIVDPFHNRLSTAGIVLSLSATVLFALYGVMGKRSCARFGGVAVTCFGFLFGGLELVLLIGLSNLPFAASALQGAGLGSLLANIPLLGGFSLAVLPVFLCVCIVNTGVGFACYFKAMETTSARETSLVFFFKPILAPVFAFLVLGEEIPLVMIAGILLILLGSMTSILPDLLLQRREKKAEESRNNTAL